LLVRCFDNPLAARDALLAQRQVEEVQLPDAVRARLREVFGAEVSAEEAVARIVAEVRSDGDEAVRRWTRRLDGADLDDVRVDPRMVDAAIEATPPSVLDALRRAADRIAAFHQRARRTSWFEPTRDGVVGQLVRPLERVAVYAPGGRALYPSTVLMAVIPARVAGVSDVVVATPPGPDGQPAPVLLAAARLAGASTVYRIGGAQAIAALAFGTESVARVDKIVGPGNIFVTLAKRAVYGHVGIDGLHGPTETLVVADATARPEWLAADLIAQAEHDPLAQPILICTSPAVASRVVDCLAEQVRGLPRASIVAQALANRGAVVVAPSMEEALELANAFAPEHLCLAVADPWRWLPLVRNAGGVFLGEVSMEALGDYVVGPSHIMPTGGTARFASALGVDDFVKVVSVFATGPSDLREIGPVATTLARAEGFEGHARSIELRLDPPADR
jgi:histidinol dehydrogenase